MQVQIKKPLLNIMKIGLCGLLSCSLPLMAAEESAKSKFVDDCYDMLDANDQRVFDVCFTDDFWVMGPETSGQPDGKLHGRAAVQGKMSMGNGDVAAYRDIQITNTIISEGPDVIVRHMHWVATGPIAGTYAAMGNPNPPEDLQVINEMIDVYTFRDGKISSQFFQYDTVNFVSTLAEDDPERIADFIVLMSTMGE